MIRHTTILKTLLASTLGLVLAAPAFADDAPVHIRGTVSDVTATGFTVQTDTGTQTVAISAATRLSGVVPSSLDQIKPGSFIGTANVVTGKSARALEVVVFPDAMKGAGLGDYAWDLPAGGGAAAGGAMMSGGSSMTNGTVKAATEGKTSSMTNGTVKTSTGTANRTLVVDYGKGEKTIRVPANVPVVTFVPADKSALVKGAHVFVVGKAGMPVNAAIVAVGLNGTVPPM
jgi:hypothetical protein